MHVLLTHEQADFDALASMLGAFLLDESAYPVLPQRMNRNVRAFLTLYGKELPYIDRLDLPGGRVDTVTLVDTQAMISVKGMSSDTRVQVVDHHPPREDLPASWSVRSEKLGATTTFFVEAAHERGCHLNAVQATLLLLGIYEDTGSLTYARTSARDIRAAAYLVESGASLEIAAGFLRHPLSMTQQRLYDQLQAEAETRTIHGQTVIIACGDAKGMQEEVSTLAHKMRDLLDPEALFLLVITSGGVQMVARSTSDHIDVGAVAAHFGGGGHERAAAALIRSDPEKERALLLEEVRSELLRILPEHVRPVITVAQIMSRGPQVLAPDTPVQEAARRMQRYGYEGYPVVADGQVVGLLTRRAVDRALAHRLNLKAASLMRAGDVTVSPDDSIEHLQNLMIDTGWGQIPVVGPETGEIVGIVTRTDLIKTLAPDPRLPGQLNLADRLASALPPARLALLLAVAEQAYAQRSAIYIVGGFVRDLLMDRPSLDFDLVVEGNAIALARALARRYGGRVTSHARFGTAKWLVGAVRTQLASQLAEGLLHQPDGPSAEPRRIRGIAPADLPESLDLVSARTEFYAHPTALPTVEQGSIKLDLHRRDFTINTLAFRLDGLHYGELHDYWGGLTDLRQRRVRVLHSLSFVDDPTRILRAVRFEKRFDFQIEERSLELLVEARPLLDRVSGDRIRHELDSVLDERHAAEMLARLDELGLLKAIHPDLEGDSWLYRQISRLDEAAPDPIWELTSDYRGIPRNRVLAYTLWLLRLPRDRAHGPISRLKLRSDLAQVILSACGLWGALGDLVGERPSQVVRRMDGTPVLALYATYLAAGEPEKRTLLENYVRRWRHVSPNISGHELQRRGLPPGPAYRHILETLRGRWLDGEIASMEEEAAALDELLQGNIAE